MYIDLVYNKGPEWYASQHIAVKGEAIDPKGKYLTRQELWAYFSTVHTGEEFVESLKKLNGIFSVVIANRKENKIWASVDRLRNYPLFYTVKDHRLFLSDQIEQLAFHTHSQAIDKCAERIMASFGYTLGKTTLLENVFQLRAGEYLIYENNHLSTGLFYDPFALKAVNLTREQLKEIVRNLLLELGKRVCTVLNNRPAALPLSGGWDSRLIALLLKLNNFTDVICFTYGKSGHPEACKSKRVAEKLGFAWKMIDYTPFITEDYLHTKDFLAYVDFIGNGVSFPYLQEYFAARYLDKELKLPKNTVLLPGHSGDALAGSHLFPDMERFDSLADFYTKISRKSGRQLMLSAKEKKFLADSVASNLYYKETPYLTHMLHETWLTWERQAKQTVNSAKVWNYFGYYYHLLLWDNELTDFFFSLPFKYKVYKNLYNEVLEELFIENDILPEDESTRMYHRQQQKKFLKYKIKPYLDFLLRFKPVHEPYDFFYFKELIEPVKNELAVVPHSNEYNAYLTAWYIEYFKKKRQ
ncbi:MAG: asparagine synthase-related protein [Tannerellaceae bacterium]|nr:hypothetical protein [Tannerellaceae bacterium]MCD8262731.1 asparagine synthase-related protein [Tannerellaceae bacterium]